MTQKNRFVAAVEQGLRQAEAGHTLPHEEVVHRMQVRFGSQAAGVVLALVEDPESAGPDTE